MIYFKEDYFLKFPLLFFNKILKFKAEFIPKFERQPPNLNPTNT